MRVFRDARVPALVAALAAGCAGGDAPDPAEAEAALARAPEATAKEASAAIELAATMRVEGDDDPLEFRGDGTLDLEEELSRIELDMSEMASFRTASASDPDLWRGTVIYAPNATLMRLPAFNSLTPEPEKWIRWSGDALVREGGAQFAAPDPLDFLVFARAVSEDVDVVGREDVHGVETVHVRGEVEVEDLPAYAAEAARGEAEAYAGRLAAAGVEAFELDVWLDDEERIRRLRASYDDMQVSASERADLVATLLLTEFGIDPRIGLPPSAEVVDIGDVIGRGPEETEHSEE
jgi:hypothetical protein